jgi:SAM-dependent methyltransferase
VNAAEDIACPLCGDRRTCDLGEILHGHPTVIAGVEVDLGDQPVRLIGCAACGFQFKHPAPAEDVLLDCYARAESGQWSLSPDPYERRFDVLKDAVERCAPPADRTPSVRRVLDVGCFNGGLLEHLGECWEKHGVEPSTEAAQVARDRGISILGPVLGDGVPSEFFDAALAIDVVEHVPDPMPFFHHLARVLRPGGVLVLLTGDTAAPSWRWQGSRYWYCSLPEHVSFFRRSTLEHAGRACGMTTVEHRRMSHIRTRASRRLNEASKNVVYGFVHRVGWLPGSRLRSRVLDRRAPGWLSARDHQLVVMCRQEPMAEKSLVTAEGIQS